MVEQLDAAFCRRSYTKWGETDVTNETLKGRVGGTGKRVLAAADTTRADEESPRCRRHKLPPDGETIAIVLRAASAPLIFKAADTVPKPVLSLSRANKHKRKSRGKGVQMAPPQKFEGRKVGG